MADETDANTDLLGNFAKKSCVGREGMEWDSRVGRSCPWELPGSRSLRSIRENVPWVKKSPPGVDRAEKMDSISDFVG